MAKKIKPDPVLDRMREKLAHHVRDVERWYAKMKRAFRALDKARTAYIRTEKKIANYQRDLLTETPTFQ